MEKNMEITIIYLGWGLGGQFQGSHGKENGKHCGIKDLEFRARGAKLLEKKMETTDEGLRA